MEGASLHSGLSSKFGNQLAGMIGQHAFPFILSDKAIAVVMEMAINIRGQNKAVPVCRIITDTGYVNLSPAQFKVLVEQKGDFEQTRSDFSVVLGPESCEEEESDDDCQIDGPGNKSFRGQFDGQLNVHLAPFCEVFPAFCEGLHVRCFVNHSASPSFEEPYIGPKEMRFVYSYGRRESKSVDLEFEEWKKLFVVQSYIQLCLGKIGDLPIFFGLGRPLPLFNAFRVLAGLLGVLLQKFEEKFCFGCRHDKASQKHHDVCLWMDFEEKVGLMSRAISEFISEGEGKAIVLLEISRQSAPIPAIEMAPILAAFDRYLENPLSRDEVSAMMLTYRKLDGHFHVFYDSAEALLMSYKLPADSP